MFLIDIDSTGRGEWVAVLYCRGHVIWRSEPFTSSREEAFPQAYCIVAEHLKERLA